MISAIVAVSANQVIGKDNRLPWKLSSDLKRFKSLTMGHPLIMGRRTFESLPKLLPGREHIVLTRSSIQSKDGVVFVKSLEEALEYCGVRDCFIIGGSKVYSRAFAVLDRLYLTRVHQTIEGDAFFPTFSTDDFEVTYQEDHLEEDVPHTFFIFDRKGAK